MSAYLIAQRKAIYAIVKDRNFELLLRFQRRHFKDQILGSIFDGICQCVMAGKPVTKESLTDELNTMPLRPEHKAIAIGALGNIVSQEEVYGTDLPDFLAAQYRKHVAETLMATLEDENITDQGRVQAIDQASHEIMDAESDAAADSSTIIDEWFSRHERGEHTLTRQKAIEIHGNEALSKMFRGVIYPAPYVICGQPGFRKTGVLQNLAVEFAARGKVGIYYTFEDSQETAALKFLAARHQLNFTELAMGTMEAEQMTELKARAFGRNIPIRINQNQYTCDSWAMDVRRNCMTRTVDWIMLDFIQAFSYNRNHEVAELNHITKMIRQLSKEFTIPIIYTSQVNDRTEDKSTGMVTLTAAAAKGSGSIFEDVRAMFLLDGSRQANEKQWKCVKNTWGPLYRGVVTFDGPSGQIIDYQWGDV